MQLGLPFSVRSAVPLPAGGVAAEGAPATPARGGDRAEPSHERPIRFVRHRSARRYVLRVDADGSVRVTIPRWGSRRDAEAFAGRHERWIARERERLASPGIPKDLQPALRARARIELPARLLALAGQHGLRVSRVSVRNQRTRWGSCGRNGHVCLNWRLVAMPSWVCEYVLVHELMHLRRLDHSPQYWALVAAACPSYREARQWLRTHGPALR